MSNYDKQIHNDDDYILIETCIYHQEKMICVFGRISPEFGIQTFHHHLLNYCYRRLNFKSPEVCVFLKDCIETLHNPTRSKRGQQYTYFQVSFN